MATVSETIATERLVLRPFLRSDALRMWRAFQDLETASFYEFSLPQPDDAVNYLDTAEACCPGTCFSVVLRETGAFIGQAIVVHALGAGKLGYWLDRRFWNKGYMTEAVKALLEHSFATVGFNRIEARIDSQNTRSARVAEKAGMKPVRSYTKDSIAYTIWSTQR